MRRMDEGTNFTENGPSDVLIAHFFFRSALRVCFVALGRLRRLSSSDPSAIHGGAVT